jgi:hypothetical protein
MLTDFIDMIVYEYPDKDNFTRTELNAVGNKYGLEKELKEFISDDTYKIKRGLWSIKPSEKKSVIDTEPEDRSGHIELLSLIPKHDNEFVPFGDFALLKKIINSKSFFPVYISGESGNGKTKMVYEACAVSSKELVRANITESTDEDDLIGGYRLVNGETIWQDGPVIEAMRRGAILLLDEINLASPKIMCLQPILEGNPIYIKKTNTVVNPKPGFNVIATANTKGKGTEDGRYIGSNTLNEALLDRFAITIEHDYPSVDVENKILKNILTSNDALTEDNIVFTKKLVDWAKIIRDTFSAGGIEEIITTRRLIHIIKFNLITKSNRIKAIKYCTSRFDSDTKKAFYSLYQKLDESVEISAVVDGGEEIKSLDEEISF